MNWILAASALLAIAAFVFSLVLARRLRRMPRVLMLHSLKPRFPDVSAIALQQFEQLLNAATKVGLKPAFLDEALADRGCFAITFDDGYDDLVGILPLVKEQKAAVTVFLPTAYLGKANEWDNLLLWGRRKHLTPEQVRELAVAGVQFGSHGHTHRDLTSLSDADLRAELLESRRILTALSSREIVSLAFPFGRYNARVSEIARSLGFRIQLTSSARREDNGVYGRVAINALDNGFTMRAKLRGSLLGGFESLKSAVISSCSYLTPLTRKIL